ncbi:MAG: dTDP-glucose 4,6-dehydratase [Deltaproteobacteria bacterium]|nr:dTDP-glucose 4,6-dehydratase [Deltaproteobacteria bacterium]
MKALITGGCGFIGTNLIRYVLSTYSDWRVVNLDLLTYAGNIENTQGLEEAYPGRYTFVRGDIADAGLIDDLFDRQRFDIVLNLAAESHVDRSIEDPSVFLRTNVLGTQILLDAALKYKVERLVQISTDEVYGSLGKHGQFTEDMNLAPNSPYSASKASADLLIRAYVKTYGLDAVITRCSNNYGPYQFPEKLIPLMVLNAYEDKELPVYGDGKNIRDWIYVGDHCRGIIMVAQSGVGGEIYNMGGDTQMENIEIVRMILDYIHKPHSLIKFVKDRPGHDFRYAMDYSKIETELGWCPAVKFEEGIEATIKWYLENKRWWEAVRTGEYMNYYERMYGGR